MLVKINTEFIIYTDKLIHYANGSSVVGIVDDEFISCPRQYPISNNNGEQMPMDQQWSPASNSHSK